MINEYSWRRNNNDPMQNIQIPEIRFASQGRKKRRKPINFRRNGPLIAKNVFISDWTSFIAPKNKPKRDMCNLIFGKYNIADGYFYNEHNSMANILLPNLQQQKSENSEIRNSFDKMPIFQNQAIDHKVYNFIIKT